jgi:hypothetical protein
MVPECFSFEKFTIFMVLDPSNNHQKASPSRYSVGWLNLKTTFSSIFVSVRPCT